MSRRAEIIARMSDVHEQVQRLASYPKPSGTQVRQLGGLREEFAALETELQELDSEDVQSRAAAAIRSGRQSGEIRFEGGSASASDGPGARIATLPGRSELRSRALSVIEQTERTTDLGRAVLDQAADWVERDDSPDDAMARWVLTAADEDYRSAFAKLIRNPTLGQYEWTDTERAAFARAQQLQRAMSVGTDSAGGFLVPFTLDPAIILTNAGTSNARLRDAFTVKTITGDSWNGVTSAGVTAEWAAEAQEVSDASPTLVAAPIPVHRGDAFVPFSFEAQGDVQGLEAELRPLLVDAKQRLEAAAFITGTGTGTGQPTGLITAAVAAGGSTIVASTTADTYAVADVYKVKAALPARYRDNAAWLANEDVYDLTRQFATGTGPQSAFWADFGEDTPPKLLGKPAYESSQLGGTVTASAANYLLVYGDLKQYYVVDRVGATIELIPHLFGANRRPTGQRGLLLWFRTGGALVNPDAVRVLNA